MTKDQETAAQVDFLLDHIIKCASIWEQTGVSRVKAITKAVEEIQAWRAGVPYKLDWKVK